MRTTGDQVLSRPEKGPPSYHPAVELSVATEDILELVRSRSSPGVLILDLDGRVVYSNPEALSLLADPEDVPAEMRRLCDQVKVGAVPGGNCALLWQQGESPYSLRAFLIGGPADGHHPTHVIMLVEKVTEQHGINLRKARATFGLSDREIEVVALVAQGLANKDIGCQLFVSEHTVKDHLKNISRKMGATRRSEIIAMLK